ncbi:MAG: hypothetical protein O9972_25040 [Burkholderiales bacterium]|nr:hypothetical protein [Burkholderiales bacterium]
MTPRRRRILFALGAAATAAVRPVHRARAIARRGRIGPPSRCPTSR